MSISSALARMKGNGAQPQWEKDDEADKAKQVEAVELKKAEQHDTDGGAALRAASIAKEQADDLRARFNRLVKAAKTGDLGLVLQKEGDQVVGLLMAVELTESGLKLAAVGKLFVGSPISVYFGG